MDTATYLWNVSTTGRWVTENITTDNLRDTTANYSFRISDDGNLILENIYPEVSEPAEEEPMDTTEVDKFLLGLAKN